MSQAHNIELVRRMFETYQTGTPEVALELLHPEVQYDATTRPDGKVWRGREGVRRAILEWTATWEDLEMHVERYIGVGDDRVVVLWNERGRGKRSGVSLSQEGVTVCTLRDGAIVAMRVAVDRHGTLRAMGLQSE